MHDAPSPDPADTAPTADDTRAFVLALVAARDSLGVIARRLSKEYAIGRRGPWIVGMIGQSASPNELASRLRIGRSLVTAELTALQEAELILYRKSRTDGRRIELSLTTRGEELNRRMADELDGYLRRLSDRHPRDRIVSCARLLLDFSGIVETDGAP